MSDRKFIEPSTNVGPFQGKGFYTFFKTLFTYVYPIAALITGISPIEYSIVTLKSRFSETDKTLEVGTGGIPYYRFFRKGDYVGVDWYPTNVRNIRRIAKFFGVDRKYLEEHIVADNNFLPFREGVFDKVVRVRGFSNDKECARVLKECGKKINVYSTYQKQNGLLKRN
jgi:hypothetical protein